MFATPPLELLTAEQLLALPDDGMDRELFRGVLRESPVMFRDRRHGRTLAHLSTHLSNWLDARPEPRGEILGYGSPFRLRRDPDSFVGIDLAYASAELVAATPEEADFFDGPPVLAVEILSPSDRQGEIDEKVALYLEMGVAVVWLMNPRFRLVSVFRPETEPVMFNALHELSAEPHLPGFRVPVAKLFGF